MAWTWHEFATTRDFRGVAGWINGFRVRRLAADCDVAIIPIVVGHFVTAAVTGECTDWIETSHEDIRLQGDEYAPYRAALPQTLELPLLTQVYAMCYAAAVAAKGAEWAGTLHPAQEE
jgi:hypothetical protein